MLATSTALEALDLELLRGRGPFKVASQGPCMSGRESDSDRVLRCQVAELRDELRRLQLRVDRQEDQLSELSRELEDSRNLSSSALEGAPSSVASVASGSYSVVTPAPAPPATGIPPSWSYREAVAREIGEFLRRSLSGHNRWKFREGKVEPFAEQDLSGSQGLSRNHHRKACEGIHPLFGGQISVLPLRKPRGFYLHWTSESA